MKFAFLLTAVFVMMAAAAQAAPSYAEANGIKVFHGPNGPQFVKKRSTKSQIKSNSGRNPAFTGHRTGLKHANVDRHRIIQAHKLEKRVFEPGLYKFTPLDRSQEITYHVRPEEGAVVPNTERLTPTETKLDSFIAQQREQQAVLHQNQVELMNHIQAQRKAFQELGNHHEHEPKVLTNPEAAKQLAADTEKGKKNGWIKWMLIAAAAGVSTYFLYKMFVSKPHDPNKGQGTGTANASPYGYGATGYGTPVSAAVPGGASGMGGATALGGGAALGGGLGSPGTIGTSPDATAAGQPSMQEIQEMANSIPESVMTAMQSQKPVKAEMCCDSNNRASCCKGIQLMGSVSCPTGIISGEMCPPKSPSTTTTSGNESTNTDQTDGTLGNKTPIGQTIPNTPGSGGVTPGGVNVADGKDTTMPSSSSSQPGSPPVSVPPGSVPLTNPPTSYVQPWTPGPNSAQPWTPGPNSGQPLTPPFNMASDPNSAQSWTPPSGLPNGSPNSGPTSTLQTHLSPFTGGPPPDQVADTTKAPSSTLPSDSDQIPNNNNNNSNKDSQTPSRADESNPSSMNSKDNVNSGAPDLSKLDLTTLQDKDLIPFGLPVVAGMRSSTNTPVLRTDGEYRDLYFNKCVPEQDSKTCTVSANDASNGNGRDGSGGSGNGPNNVPGGVSNDGSNVPSGRGDSRVQFDQSGGQNGGLGGNSGGGNGGVPPYPGSNIPNNSQPGNLSKRSVSQPPHRVGTM